MSPNAETKVNDPSEFYTKTARELKNQGVEIDKIDNKVSAVTKELDKLSHSVAGKLSKLERDIDSMKQDNLKGFEKLQESNYANALKSSKDMSELKDYIYKTNKEGFEKITNLSKEQREKTEQLRKELGSDIKSIKEKCDDLNKENMSTARLVYVVIAIAVGMGSSMLPSFLKLGL